jgi:hypothetical protein
MLWLAAALGAPRAVVLPAPGPDGVPTVLQVDEAAATVAMGVIDAPDMVYPDRHQARAAANHPVLFPLDVLGEELRDEAAHAVRVHLTQDAHREVLEALLVAVDPTDDLAIWLAVGASLGGMPLDTLPSAVQERASYDAAAFRARNRPMGILHDDPAIAGPWARQVWLATQPPDAAMLEQHLDALVDLAHPLARIREDGEALTGHGGVLGAPVHGPSSPASKGFLGRVHQALVAIDSGGMRTGALPVPLPDGPLTPVVTVEPSAFPGRCVEALDALPARLRSPRYVRLHARCATADRQQRRDRGEEVAGAGWTDPELPLGGPRVLPLTWSHAHPMEGLARVGFQVLDVGVQYALPPRPVTEAPPPSGGVTRRSLVVPVWVPFRGPSPPSAEDLDRATATGTREGATAILRPTAPDRPCGCTSIAMGPGFLVLLALGLVRGRQ